MILHLVNGACMKRLTRKNSRILVVVTFVLAIFQSNCGTEDGESPVLPTVGPDETTFRCTEITSNSQSPLGVNLMWLDYFRESNWRVIDAFIKANPNWVADSPTLGWEGGTITSFDGNGWPTGVEGDTRPTTQMFVDIDGQYPTGTYVVHWEGSGGVLGVDGDATNIRCENGGPISDCSSRRGLFDVDSTSAEGIVFSIIPGDESTYSRDNYLNNISVIMPGGMCGSSTANLNRFEYCESSRGGVGTCSQGNSCIDFDEIYWNRYSDEFTEIQNPKVLFHPKSMRDLRKFRSLRYQEMMHMQGTTVTDWASRTQKEHFSWAGIDGPPPEITVYMSNLLNADPWMNIPHRATDDYVSNLAQFYHNHLLSNLQVYLEYSNEPWNPDTVNFPQSAYFLEQAEAQGIGGGNPDYIRKSLAYASRAAEVFRLWTNEYGSDSGRLTRLLSSWAGFNDVAPAMLEFGDVRNNVDAIATGVYIGIYILFAEHESEVENWTVETVMKEIEDGLLNDPDAPNGALEAAKQFVTDNIAIANRYGVDLLGYESGSHFWSADTETNEKIGELFRNVVADSRLGNYYLELYGHWRDSGGKLIHNFVHMFPHKGNQTFGTLPHESAQCSDYPKAGAVNQFIMDNPCWWSGCEK